MKIHCMIIDDEPLSRDILLKYIDGLPFLRLSAICRNAIEAMEKLKEEPADLLFLDINMPRLSGMDFIRTLQDPPLVIFTTAYPGYAVEGFEVNAVDYLIKPFSFDRFLRAVNKAAEIIDHRGNARYRTDTFPADPYLLVKSDKRYFRMERDNILYFQSVGDYVKIVANDQTIVAHETLKNLEQKLAGHPFLRIHKSYIVSLNHISYLEGNQVKIKDTLLPVGASYKQQLLDKLRAR